MKNIILENFHSEGNEFLKRLYEPYKGKEGNGYVGYPIIAVYENPSDFKGKFVARLFVVNRELKKEMVTEYCVVKDSLEEIREAIPKSLIGLNRYANDDPCIVEVYI